jgi:hypothetical protein
VRRCFTTTMTASSLTLLRRPEWETIAGEWGPSLEITTTMAGSTCLK